MLKIISLEEVNKIKKNMIKIINDSDDFYKATPHRLLDVFPHSLSKEEANEVSWDFKDLYLQNEYKQVDFFRELYKENGNSIIIAEIEYANIDEHRHIRILDGLDRLEQYLWVNHMIRTDINQVTGYFSVETFDDFKMLLQINSRELTFRNLHFLGLDISIRGHFDMSMEMFFKNENQILDLENKARKHGLYLRT